MGAIRYSGSISAVPTTNKQLLGGKRIRAIYQNDSLKTEYIYRQTYEQTYRQTDMAESTHLVTLIIYIYTYVDIDLETH